MKITGIVEEGDFMRVSTKDHGDFVYKKDKFANRGALKKEILRSISGRVKRKNMKKIRFERVKNNA